MDGTTEVNDNFVGVILAGGLSSRMGQDKALLAMAGESLLMRCQRILKQAGATTIVISRNDGAPSHLADHYPQCGPLGGIHAALRTHVEQPLLIIPVDLPLLAPVTLIKLVHAGLQAGSNAHYDGHNLPLFICRPADLIKPLEETLNSADNLSVGRFFSRFPRLTLPPDNSSALTNANTPAQWQAILQAHKPGITCP
ncbi:MAG: molybdenum cofactor guanylyltransferase [Parahaliea sp.]